MPTLKAPYERGTGRYPKPRHPVKAAVRKKMLEKDLQALYAEVMDGEAVLLFRLPGWQNAERLIEGALAALVRISYGPDAEWALKACAMLLEFANRQIERAGTKLESSAVLAQLETLYRKALPSEPVEALVVEEEPKR